MSDSFANNNPDSIDGLQDEPEQNRRRSLIWALLALLLICLLVGGSAYAFTRRGDAEELPALEVEEPTAVPTEQVTDEPTDAPTDQPTEEPTSEPTDEPTAEPTAEPTDPPTRVPPPVVPNEPPPPVTTLEPTDPPGHVCDDPGNGGYVWEGVACTCDGVETHTIVCGNVTFNNPTGNTCQRPSDCPAPEPDSPPGGSTCKPTALSCYDGKDNDCDGAVDEYPDECYLG